MSPFPFFLTTRLTWRSNQLNRGKPKALSVQADISLLITTMGVNGYLLWSDRLLAYF
ncbi:MAG: hypothetical protein V7K98_19465 [Nostoc sp.]|uniref:hypothetical protein n=1 Tax=Nostoc sp. TaxID=1180 RepID=UPI002FF70B37